MLFSALLLYLLLEQCSAEPYTVGWQDDPSGRGTTTLIISCVTTLGLCVWSSMHLNVPEKGETFFGYTKRTLQWVLLGVLIPELVILAAWRQWLSARRLTDRIQEALRQQEDSGRRYPWTVEHSYFAGMGGFVFDPESLPKDENALFVSDVQQLTLTASGTLLLAECGHLPDIDPASIKDKNKQDSLSKTVVFIQVSWMIAQTIGRLAAHMPVTLLEVNTLGHVFCAFVIYVLWWKKPKEVRHPYVLRGEWTAPLAAFMYMSSRMSGSRPEARIKLHRFEFKSMILKKWIRPELSELGWYPHGAIELQDTAQVERSIGLETSPISPDTITSSESTASDGELRKRPPKTLTKLPTTLVTITETRSQLPDQLRSNRIKACGEAIRQYTAVRSRFESVEEHSFMRPKPSQLVTTTASNWPSDDLLPGLSGKTMGMALWLSSSLYGGIHLAAWMDFFPTEAEEQLWRFSAAFIAASGALWFSFCLIASRWPAASDYWHRFIDVKATHLEYVLFGTIAGLCAVTYVLTRLYLVVEAIVSLRKLPSTAYETPDWSKVFPHV